jgi:chromosome segregation ATPase
VTSKQKQSDLNDLEMTLDDIQSQIKALSQLIKVKDSILEEATQSSLEMKKAKKNFEDKICELKIESAVIRKQLRSAQRSLALAEGHRKGHKGHQNNFQYRAKVDDYRGKLSELRDKMEKMETCLALMTHEHEKKIELNTSHEIAAKIQMEAQLNLELEKKNGLENELKQDQIRIRQLEDQLKVKELQSIQMSQELVKQQKWLEKVENLQNHHKSEDGQKCSEIEHAKARIEDLRLYKDMLLEERHLLEHFKECSQNLKTHCKHCRMLAKKSFTKEDKQRLDKINVLFQGIYLYNNLTKPFTTVCSVTIP